MYLFRLVSDRELSATVPATQTLFRARPVESYSRVLFPIPEKNLWREKERFSKEAILRQACGYTLKMNQGRDARSMSDFLRVVPGSGFQDSGLAHFSQCLPTVAPLLDFLVEDTAQPT